MTERMNPDVKAKWLTALRSGEYVQGQSALRIVVEDGADEQVFHCCLGVLADLYRKDVGGGWYEGQASGDALRDRKGVMADGSYLTDDIRRWAGAPIDKIDDWVPSSRATLAELNDDHDYTFPEIADLIEEEL